MIEFHLKNENNPIPEGISTLVIECPVSKSLIFPDSLKNLYYKRKSRIEIINELPDSLEVLVCQRRGLQQLPYVLPKNLKGLFVFDNKLTILPDLPKGLISLGCNKNPIKNLPRSLKYLNIRDTCIIEFPISLLDLNLKLNYFYYDEDLTKEQKEFIKEYHKKINKLREMRRQEYEKKISCVVI